MAYKLDGGLHYSMKKLVTIWRAGLFALLGVCSASLDAQVLAPAGLPFNYPVRFLKDLGKEMYVAQWIGKINGLDQYQVSVWNGRTWRGLPRLVMSPGSEIRDMALYNGKLWVGGKFNAYNSNGLISFTEGQGWQKGATFFTGTAEAPAVNALTVFKSQLMVGGLFQKMNSTICNHLAKFDGANATAIIVNSNAGASHPITQLIGDTNVLYIGGTFEKIGGSRAHALATWNGTSYEDIGEDFKVVEKMRLIGRSLYVFARDSVSAPLIAIRKQNIWEGVKTLDTLVSIRNFFALGNQVYLLGAWRQNGFERTFLYTLQQNTGEPIFTFIKGAEHAESFDGIFVGGNLQSNGFARNEPFSLGRIVFNRIRVVGRIFYDKNTDGKWNIGEPGLPGRVIKLGVGLVSTVSDDNGFFDFVMPKLAETYKLSVEPVRNWIDVPGFTFTVDTTKPVNELSIPQNPEKTDIKDVAINVTSAQGWEAQTDKSEYYVITVKNNGLVGTPADVNLNFNSKIADVKADPAPDVINTGKVTWNVGTLPSGGSTRIVVRLTLPNTGFAIGDQVLFNAEASAPNDDDPSNNTDSLFQTVNGLAKLNAKYQYPAEGAMDSFATYDPTLGNVSYVIKFMNETTDTVYSVVVRDTIAIPKWVAYIQETGSSHNFTRQIYTNPDLPGKLVVVYTFNGIKLPPNPLKNPEMVQCGGFIGFRVGMDPNMSIPEGYMMENTAFIYLDGGEGIPTNTVYCMAPKTVSTGVIEGKEMQVVLYPNPAENWVRWKLGDGVSVKAFHFYDVCGRRLGSVSAENQSQIDLGQFAWATGTVIWEAEMQGRGVQRGILKIMP